MSLTGETRALLEKDGSGAANYGGSQSQPLMPPLDYALKTDPVQKGQLADDYGLGDIPHKE